MNKPGQNEKLISSPGAENEANLFSFTQIYSDASKKYKGIDVYKMDDNSNLDLNAVGKSKLDQSSYIFSETRRHYKRQAAVQNLSKYLP